jgi:hypothetical protein
LSYADEYGEWRSFPIIRTGISSGAGVMEQKLDVDVLEVAKCSSYPSATGISP